MDSIFDFFVCNIKYIDNVNIKIKGKGKLVRNVIIFNDVILMKFEDSFFKFLVKWCFEIFVRFKEFFSFGSGGENCIEIFYIDWWLVL